MLGLVQTLPPWQPARNARNEPVAMREYVQLSLPSCTITTGRPIVFESASAPEKVG